MLRIVGLMIISALICTARAQQETPKPVEIPWDTLTAEIQYARALAVPDSIKDRVIQDQFASRRVTLAQYRQFYKSFFKQNLKEQRQFIERVKSILLERINKSKQSGTSGNSSKTNKSKAGPGPKLIK